MSKAIRAIHADIKASQEKIERKLQKKNTKLFSQTYHSEVIL
jgi:hypothetical protein